ncbi:hypothetical protein ACNS7O_02765 [Haloferacaceae archaeon DSL9]
MIDENRAERLAELHARLVATAELPVDPRASPWLGEAEAVVGDLVDDSPSEAVVERRLEQAARLLDGIETTGHEEADEHVAAARKLLDRLRKSR